MRVATWNLQCVRPGSGDRSERIRAALAPIAPDVWVFTESHPDFVPAPGYARVAMSTEAPDRERGGRWVVIWARTMVVATPLAVQGEPERSAGVRIERPGRSPVLLFGTVLPWRSDARHPDVRGGPAFTRSLERQATDWVAARAGVPGAELCVAGDFNQELGRDGPAGTRAGREVLDRTLATLGLCCVTGGEGDPLLARGWAENIDHVLLSQGLRAVAAPEVWPEQFPLPRTLSDHHGICVQVADA